MSSKFFRPKKGQSPQTQAQTDNNNNAPSLGLKAPKIDANKILPNNTTTTTTTNTTTKPATKSKFGSSSSLSGWSSITPRGNEAINESSSFKNQQQSSNKNKNKQFLSLHNNNNNNNSNNNNNRKVDTNFHENDGRDLTKISKHQLPLQYRWTLWHTAAQQDLRRQRGRQKYQKQQWTNDFKKIASFDTVLSFWQLFNNIAAPSMLPPGSSYHLFKGQVEPAWEDEFNEGGGAWTFRFESTNSNKDKSSSNKNNDFENMINYAWYYTILNMIGNQFKYNDDICGAVISIRKNGRGKIELWMKNAKHLGTVMEIGKDFRQFSGAQRRDVAINFISHADNKAGKRDRSINLPEYNESYHGYRR